ncbi:MULTISPECIES: conjugative transfer signal peptidase TraF [Rhizobium]|uniref:Conjugal transfer protein TraF n=7 Tax=Rhizobium TaxID=379 RepID=N6U1U4_9HYPH|nr:MULTISPECIES: conjugative transfer signal peptidase TraF [Rhizobium]AGB73795.1 conjugal transfer protein TraF [Rhizobium tropici CIAT 899]AYG77037.1 conjugative transfer signal peptidase TraF [Rhizobium sp. CCGE532]ENN86599.1 conjugal transfer protein TraF [Rhizobium freirei PRF 81]MDK4743164.1 conjugative transfer signal peptidase TraF [Rhizobium sp. CNPSo 3464]NEV14371.1 conjugative transfer signal peptidase TraF [Rhizobium tropici]
MTRPGRTRERAMAQRKQAAVTSSVSAAAIAVIGLAGLLGSYRINLTPSEPLGLWQIVPLDRSPGVDDLVFICPPDTAAMHEARARGYLRSGLCPGHLAPLIKSVVAVAGQRVEIANEVTVDGRLVRASTVAEKDGEGRPLTRFSGGVVPGGEVFLHSAFAGSFDSRYFGPVPTSGILGLAREVLTYAP